MTHAHIQNAIVLVLVLCAISVHAAEPTFGVRMGMSIGSPIPLGNIPEGAKGSAVVGLVTGFSVNWDFGGPWSVLSELQYVHYGATFSTPLKDQPYIDKVPVVAPDGRVVIFQVNTTFTGTATGSFSNDYIQVPVLAAYKASKYVGLVGGLYAGWLFATSTHAMGVGTVGIRPETVGKDMYFNEKINGLDYGLQLGVNYAITDALVADMRGTMGLTSIFDKDFQTVDRTVRNIYVHLTAVYLFGTLFGT